MSGLLVKFSSIVIPKYFTALVLIKVGSFIINFKFAEMAVYEPECNWLMRVCSLLTSSLLFLILR